VSAVPIDGEHVRMTLESFTKLLEQDKALRHEIAALKEENERLRKK
jgi:cell division protein FtsB